MAGEEVVFALPVPFGRLLRRPPHRLVLASTDTLSGTDVPARLDRELRRRLGRRHRRATSIAAAPLSVLLRGPH